MAGRLPAAPGEGAADDWVEPSSVEEELGEEATGPEVPAGTPNPARGGAARTPIRMTGTNLFGQGNTPSGSGAFD